MAKVKSSSGGDPISSGETVTIDLQQFLTPLSIFVSGLMISASIFFSFSGASIGTTRTGGTVTTTPTAVADPGTGNTTATVNIDDDPVLGNRDSAKVAIVEFSDFECPFCQRFHNDTFDALIEQYVDSGEAIFVYRDFPLSFHEPAATKAANAAQCVFEQKGSNAFFNFAQQYYEKTVSNGSGLPTGTTLETLARSIEGMDIGKFNNCVTSNTYADEVAKDTADGSAAGVTGTPGFVIGVLDGDGNVDGVIVPGAQPLATFQQVIDEQLAR
ncbi:MAG: Disulfide bond formation protein D precursor [candidate division WS6 bacterium OLB20]|uniref:Disulfide bond formation protein D n=1 Tax=candidate division WS6 bacterium OLB20 TaxID=1617426 RepID=A0A136M014_9BACT|nr:MAG: Disulfide bond formation protein D precursor [candidate division WS6 bacterium OLB20]